MAWREAYEHFARAARLQPSNWRYARSAGRLADAMGAYSAAAAYEEAVVDAVRIEFGETHQEMAIAIGEKSLGGDHPNTAARYNNLAGLLKTTGRYDEAEPLYRKALAIMTSTLGTEHPHTKTVANNLDDLLEQIKGALPSQ